MPRALFTISLLTTITLMVFPALAKGGPAWYLIAFFASVVLSFAGVIARRALSSRSSGRPDFAPLVDALEPMVFNAVLSAVLLALMAGVALYVRYNL